MTVLQTMLEDKLKATDWEATNETISEQVARESYLQWLKDNEKRNKVPSLTHRTHPQPRLARGRRRQAPPAYAPGLMCSGLGNRIHCH